MTGFDIFPYPDKNANEVKMKNFSGIKILAALALAAIFIFAPAYAFCQTPDTAPALMPAAPRAKVYIDLAAPAIKKLPIAVQEFSETSSAGSPAGEKIANAIKAELIDALTGDLRFSNLFTFIKKEAFLEDPAKSGVTLKDTNFKDWRAVGADALIKGRFTIEKDSLTVEVRLFDCVDEKEILGKRYVGSISSTRRLAHYFADQIYEELTGRKGIFGTKLLFVSKRTGNKEVFMSDYDGKGVRQITRNRAINLSPYWAPDGKKIVYTSYKKGWPCLFMLDLSIGRDAALSDRPGINIGGRISPDGRSAALTLSGKKSTELYSMDIAARSYKQLTDNSANDVSPAWSPDGKRLAYVSDSSGNPHIFVLELETGEIKRFTYSGKYNASPAWSPDGREIAFSRQDNGEFNIRVQGLGDADATQLTFEGDNRSPSWSPDSRQIVFSKGAGGSSFLYIMNADGTGLVKIDTGGLTESQPSWSPFME